MTDRVEAIDAVDAEIAAKLNGSLVASAYPRSIDHAAINRRAASLGRGFRPGTKPALAGAVAGVALVAILAAGTSLNRTPSPAGGGSPLPVRVVEISQAVSYGSIGELAAASDLVVLVVPESSSTAPDPETPSLPRTDFAVRVDRVLRGSPASGQVTVLQTGGPSGGELVEVRDDPLMALGDQVVLFLRRLPGAEPKYMIVGGPQGRLVVRGGERVSSLPAGLPGVDLTLTSLQASIQ